MHAPRNYVLIFLGNTDGSPGIISGLSESDLKLEIQKRKLTKYDYAIIQGQVHKGFQ